MSREHAEQSGTSRLHVQVAQPREFPRPALAYQQVFHVVPVHMIPGTAGIGSDQSQAWNARRPYSARLGPSLTAAVKEGPLVPSDQIPLWSKAKCLVPVLNWLACVAMVPNLCPRLSVPIILDAPRFITLDAHS